MVKTAGGNTQKAGSANLQSVEVRFPFFACMCN